ncbi:hypothetical protein I3843_05G083000 [Carya illinoinensis]|uniref:Cyclin-like domain-containing protein n=3 Tax=Carya illinoinensis TaxID=32201 RepID=A0A922F0T7_CARIL|nr:hypothetical protein I3842_05G089400 [Carya illinoinensis]KAG7978441.1 hypothetical protein I3843_05G083000 [Carya illinoinensis]
MFFELGHLIPLIAFRVCGNRVYCSCGLILKVIKMGGSKENYPCLIRPSSFQEGPRMGDAKFVQEMGHNHRLVLGDIDQNVVGVTLNHFVVNEAEFKGKFAAQMVQQCPGGLCEAKKHTSLAPNPCSLDDGTIIDVEECEDASDGGVPMFVKHTEDMLDEIDRMEEIEMEDVEDPVIDVDSSDLKDPLAVVEYIDDIIAYCRKTEYSSCVSPNYMTHQFDINEKMRAILIDWLIEVHYKFELMDETLFLTVNLIDRFLERQTVIRKKLQLVGLTAILLGCKYEEVSVPLVEDLLLLSDKAYTRKEVIDMERLMVNKLQFNLSVPTPYVFMRRFLKAAQSNQKLELLSFFIIELCLVEYEMLKFPPSLLAAAAIYTAQCNLYYSFKQWSRTSEW